MSELQGEKIQGNLGNCCKNIDRDDDSLEYGGDSRDEEKWRFRIYFGNRSKRTCCLGVEKKENQMFFHHFSLRIT